MKRGLAGIAGLAAAGWMGVLFAQEPPRDQPPAPDPVAEPVPAPSSQPDEPGPPPDPVSSEPAGVQPGPESSATALPARPPEPPPGRGTLVFGTRAWYWAHFAQVSSFPLDETGFKDGLTWSLEHRLRVRPQVLFGEKLKAVGEGDLLAGRIAGATSATGKDVLLDPRDRNRFYGRAMLRELYVEWTSKIGMLRVGQMTSSWGLGLVANSGEDMEDGFADTRFGDLVERVLFATRPIEAFSDSDFAKHCYLVLAGDLVFRDEHAALVQGDRAFEGAGSMFYQDDRTFAGVYGAYRNQVYDDGDRLWAVALDVHAKHTADLDGHGTKLTAALEGAYLLGHTNAALFERARDGLDIRSWGAVARATVDVPKIGLRPSLELGVASGDGDLQDATSRGFTFDPDYQVGSILFQEVLGRMSARATDRVSDPGLVKVPIRGYELAATNGSVTNAFYLYPKIRYWPIPDLEIRAAFLWARALADVADPYNTAQNGGYPRSYRGASGNRDLGMETDLSITWRIPISDPLAFRIGIQGAWLKPGSAFDDANGKALGSIFKVRGLLDFLY